MSNHPTSRIARHVPSPLRAPLQVHTASIIASQPDIIPPSPPPPRLGNYSPPPQSEFGSRRSGPPLSNRLPSPPLGHWQTLKSTLESGGPPPATGLVLEVEGRRKVEAFVASTRHEEDEEEENVAPVQQHPEVDNIGILAQKRPFRITTTTGRQRGGRTSAASSTALVTFSTTTTSCIENISSCEYDGLPPPGALALPRKKSILANSFVGGGGGGGGKENRRPQVQSRVRVPTPPVTSAISAAAIGVHLRPVQRGEATTTGITRPLLSRASSPSRESLFPRPFPLVIRKESAHSVLSSSVVRRRQSQVRSAQSPGAASAVGVVVPTGIKALIEDVDRFAKGWTGMFNDLFADRGEDLLASTLKPAPAQVSQDDNYDPATAGREFNSNDLRPRSSEGVVPVNALQTSSLVRGEG
jgi:hypothetical protein